MRFLLFCAFYLFRPALDGCESKFATNFHRLTKIICLPRCSPRRIGIFMPHVSRIRNLRNIRSRRRELHRSRWRIVASRFFPAHLADPLTLTMALLNSCDNSSLAQHESKYRSHFSLSHSDRRREFSSFSRRSEKTPGPAFLPDGLNESG